MKQLVIIGARGWGREVWNMAAHDIPAFIGGEMGIKGFLDDKRGAFSGLRGEYPPILSSVESYEPEEDDVFVCALGDCAYRKKYADMILSKGGQFISLISPMARVNATARIGIGSIVCPWSAVSDNVNLGDFAMVHSYSNLGHDVTVGKYCSIESHVFCGGGAQIGDMCTLHVRSAILPRKKIGDNVTVGFGSVVMRNVASGLHVFGNPAKRIDF